LDASVYIYYNRQDEEVATHLFAMTKVSIGAQARFSFSPWAVAHITTEVNNLIYSKNTAQVTQRKYPAQLRSRSKVGTRCKAQRKTSSCPCLIGSAGQISCPVALCLVDW
jgi:hypothetical protein